MRLFAFFLAIGALYGDTCVDLARHGKAAAARACYENESHSPNAATRADGYFGLHDYQQANNAFREADRSHPNSAEIKTAWGSLYLANAQPADAGTLFQEAMSADGKYAPAYLGLARALAENYDKNAVALAHKALELDPHYVAAQEFLAFLALEDSDRKLATAEAEKAVALSPDALDGMAVLASMDLLEGDGENLRDQSPWLTRLLKVDPEYGEAYATAAHFFEINYRYTEAIAAYRRALELTPDLLAARSRLGVNLMRLGETNEAKRQLTECFNQHFRNSETVNSLRFLDTENQYDHFISPTTEIVINKSEAALLRPYVDHELKLAMANYERKYGLKLKQRVRIEIYPNHDDFVVRTLGLPGQGGLLGVTFNTVVALDSPSARPAGDFSWADTMWHELCHVYTISATHHLVPRWFSEGLAVHEEHEASPRWGERLSPDTVEAIRQKKLLPVAELDLGFVRPQYAGQVLVSYYQAGQVLDYIAQRWSDSAILGMMHSYAAHKTTSEAIRDNLHESAEAFDKDFNGWLLQRINPTITHFDQWKQNVQAAQAAMKAGNAAEAQKQFSLARDNFPEFSETYAALAECNVKLGKKAEVLTALEQYQARGGFNVSRLMQLARLEDEQGRADKALDAWREVNLIYPEEEEVHSQLGGLLLKQGKADDAVEEYRAALALKPADAAVSHFELARALNADHKPSNAKEEVLLALEAAPDYKPAQQLLLELSK